MREGLCGGCWKTTKKALEGFWLIEFRSELAYHVSRQFPDYHVLLTLLLEPLAGKELARGVHNDFAF